MKVINEAIKLINGTNTFDGKRPYLYSQSTWPGSGAFGGTWIGDISKEWDSLRGVIS